MLKGSILPVELVILIGLQATGKTTFSQTYYAETHAHISKDRLRNNKNRTRRQTQLIETTLQARHSVVVDNTNPTIEERRSLIHQGRLYGAEIIGYYFESQVAFCLERNQTRLGKARVPDVAIYATIKKLTPPAYVEGFHRLFKVRTGNSHTFEIHPWTEAEISISQAD